MYSSGSCGLLSNPVGGGRYKFICWENGRGNRRLAGGQCDRPTEVSVEGEKREQERKREREGGSKELRGNEREERGG